MSELEPVNQAIVPEVVDKGKRIDSIKKVIMELESQLLEAAPPEKIKGWILDLCQANDIKVDKFGDRFETPNWHARDRGIERIFQLLKIQQSDDGKPQGNMPTKISIQIIDNRPAPNP